MRRATESSGTNRRHRRQRLMGLETPFGQVLDLSDSGALLFRKGDEPPAVGSELSLELADGTERVAVRARVVRTQALGLRRYEVGVAFLSLDDAQLGLIRHIAAHAAADFSPRAYLAA
ncbi:MAG: PilZ domain-containing protein [Planctomycetota bacterium]